MDIQYSKEKLFLKQRQKDKKKKRQTFDSRHIDKETKRQRDKQADSQTDTETALKEGKI